MTYIVSGGALNSTHSLTYRAPQATYLRPHWCCVTDRGGPGVQPKPQLKPALTDFDIQPNSRM